MAKKKPNNETTSDKVASTAAKLLGDPESSNEVKTVAASALTQKADKKEKPKKMQQLLVGVNFRADGDEEETRIEAGPVEAGSLPPALEQRLRDKKKLIDLK